MKKWCSTYWLYVMYSLGGIMAVISILNWQEWSIPQQAIALNALILPLHVLEEWQFPAGFHYQYNTMWKSELPDRYPMNMQSDMITNLVGELLFIIFLFWGDISGIALAIMVFDFLEVFVHTVMGVRMHYLLRSKGKKTIYGPGSLTAYFGHGIVGIWLASWAAGNGINGGDFGIMFVVLVGMLFGMILLPENLLKSKNTPYSFPTNGYYDRFLK